MMPDKLESTARALVADGKGILAADESSGTIKKRFDSVGLESTADNRRTYRELFFTTPGIEEFISGVILFDETIRQTTQDGTPLRDILAQKGITIGIKVDKGTVNLADFPGEKITEGLDGLRERLDEYRELGAQFTKWRAVITIGDGIPTRFCIDANAHALARFAAISQDAGLVPIVEPEVLMDGNHDIDQCEKVTETTLQSVFSQLMEHRVMLEGMLLKSSMVLPGKDSPKQASVEEVAQATLRCMRRVVPSAVPGIVFLSGGQSAEQATEHLNAMNTIGGNPWQLSFSYARALQGPSLEVWKGDPANIPEAQKVFYHRAKCNSAARRGRYFKQMETAAA